MSTSLIIREMCITDIFIITGIGTIVLMYIAYLIDKEWRKEEDDT